MVVNGEEGDDDDDNDDDDDDDDGDDDDGDDDDDDDGDDDGDGDDDESYRVTSLLSLLFRHAESIYILILVCCPCPVVPFDVIDSTMLHKTLALCTSLSCKSMPDRSHSLT